MSSFSIFKPNFTNIPESTWISFPEVDINYDQSGFITSRGLSSNYNLACQISPVSITFQNLVVKYSCLSGNCYSGNNLNDFNIIFYKNGIPTDLKINIQNVLSSDGPIIKSFSNKVNISPQDTWSIYIAPGANPPTTGNNIWCISISYL